MHQNEGLMLVWGVQDDSKNNNLQFLLHKTGKNDEYKISVEIQTDSSSVEDFEILLNTA